MHKDLEISTQTGEFLKMQIPCPKYKCRNYAKACYNENRWVRWIDIICSCGFKKRMKEDELDTIQPTSPLFEIVYKTNPFDEYKKTEHNKVIETEKRKEKLDYEYDKKFSKPWERKFVKDKVLFNK